MISNKFDVSSVVTLVSAAAGTAAGAHYAPATGPAGGELGALSSARLNKKLQPVMAEIGMGICVVTNDDIFYFKNKRRIDAVGQSLLEIKIA